MTLTLSVSVVAKVYTVNIMIAVKRLFKILEIPQRNTKFACIDSTNVNSGERNGLK